MATGWQRLGEMLAGGGGDEAYRARMLENARLGQELTRDDLLRGKRIAMETLGEALAGFGYSPEQARAAQALAWAGKNPEQFTGARLDLGKISAQDAALEAVRQGGGIDAANPYLAVLQGKPVATVDIKGDTLFNPYGTLDQALVPTPLGEARIGERKAAEVENYAQADSARSRGALADAKRTTPGLFYGNGGMTGTQGMPTIPGPRGLVLVSSGDKTMDRQRWQTAEASLEVLDLINSIREVGQDERNYGLTGKLRGTFQNLAEQGDALAAQFGGEARRIRDEIRATGSDVNMEFFDPNLPVLEFMSNVLAYKQARALSGGGQLSNRDVADARKNIDPTSMMSSKRSYMATLDALERMNTDRIVRMTPRAQAELGLPQGLADALAVGGPPPGLLDSSSAESLIAQIEADLGRPLTAIERQQAIQQMTTGQGEFNVSVGAPPTAKTPYSDMSDEELIRLLEAL